MVPWPTYTHRNKLKNKIINLRGKGYNKYTCTQEREGKDGRWRLWSRWTKEPGRALHGRSLHCFATFLLSLKLHKIKMIPKSSLKKDGNVFYVTKCSQPSVWPVNLSNWGSKISGMKTQISELAVISNCRWLQSLESGKEVKYKHYAIHMWELRSVGSDSPSGRRTQNTKAQLFSCKPQIRTPAVALPH